MIATGSEFVHLDYGEAIQVVERANEKFESPVEWGVDPQSEHERYLTEKYAKQPVIVMNCPNAIKAFSMRLSDDGRTVAAMDVGAGDRRDHRRQPARGAARGLGCTYGGARHRPDHYAWYRDLRRYGTVPLPPP
jgi:asparaginyl-tRNA synthetase